MMDELERAAFWWTNVPGPHGAVQAAADALAGARPVLVLATDDTAWPDTMRGVLEEEFKGRTGAYDMIATRIDARDWEEGSDPGRFLLSRYASPADQKRFRPGGSTSVQSFLQANDILANRLFWVHGLSAKSAEDWLQFVRGLETGPVENGLFILESGAAPPCEAGQRTAVVDLGRRTTRGDVQLFCHFVLGTADTAKTQWTDYAATVAAHLCGTDAWLAARLAEDPALAAQGPVMVLEDIMAAAPERGTAPDHPFQLLRDGNTEELTRRIWTAQIEVLFPVLELERLSIIREWKAHIQRALDEMPLERFGEQITQAEDAELGVLVHMMGTRIGPGQYHLYLPSEPTRERITFLHHCRNLLAHADVCGPVEVAGLLGRDAPLQ